MCYCIAMTAGCGAVGGRVFADGRWVGGRRGLRRRFDSAVVVLASSRQVPLEWAPMRSAYNGFYTRE